MSKTWLITGASRGLGRAFAEAVLKADDRLVATARGGVLVTRMTAESMLSHSRSGPRSGP